MFRSQDIEYFNKKIDHYKNDMSKIVFSKFEPTPDKRKNIYIAILNFIKKNNRIVYGGWAHNTLIKDINPDDQFYSEYSASDVEFYSPDPIGDLMNLCEELHQLGFEYINGKNAQHEETYKLFVEFVNFSDISYMPQNICDNLPVIVINGIKYVHPTIIAIDFYRIFNNPINAFRLWEKIIGRSTILFKYYPITKSKINKPNFTSKLANSKEILDYIRKKILHESELINIGFLAYNYFVKKADMSEYIIEEPYYEIISVNYQDDRNKIYETLKSKYGNKIKYDEYYPFYQYFGKKTVFMYDNQPILIMYSNFDICTVNQYSQKKKMFFGTYLLTLMYMLSNFAYSFVYKLGKDDEWLNLFSILEKAKNNYFEKYNKNGTDESPFKHFIFNCIGTTQDPLRKYLLNVIEKKKKQIKSGFDYKPSGQIGKIPEFRFNDSTGNKINKNLKN